MKYLINIYRLLFILFLAVTLGLIVLKFQINANSINDELSVNEPPLNVKVINQSKEFDSNISNIIFNDDNIIVNLENKSLFSSNNNNDIFNLDNFSIIEGGPVDYFLQEQETNYFLINNKIYQNENNLTLVIDFDLEEFICKGFLITEQLMIAYGQKNGDAAIMKINLEEDEKIERTFGGLQDEIFIKAFVINQKIFLIGEKDSVSFESDLQNVGLPNTRKIFMITLDDNMDKESEIYFNESTDSEFFQEIIVFDNFFYLMLNSSLFKLDFNLNLVPQEEEVIHDVNKKYYLVSRNDELVILHSDEEKYYVNDIFLTNIEEKIIYNKIVNGNLLVYTIYNNILKCYEISEYHIEKNETIYANRFYPEVNYQNKLIVKSFFENLEIDILNLEPNLPKNIHGRYQINYQIMKENGEIFYIKGAYELKPYVNIIEDGVYPINKELFFYGYATLNGKTIYNGYSISNEGSYELIIKNANDEEKIYHFQVVDGYYKEDEGITIDVDQIVNKNSIFNITIDFKGIVNQKIKTLYVNDQKYDSFVQENNKIIISFISENHYGVKNYHIDKIEYDDQLLKEYIINENYLVKTIKDSPQIFLNKEIDNQKIKLSFEINDQDRAINYLKTETYDGNNLVSINYNYLNQKISISNQNKRKNIIVKHYLVCNNGDKKIELLLLDLETNNFKIEKGLSSAIVTNNYLTNIDIELDPSYGEIIKLNANNINLIKDLKIVDQSLNPKIIILIALLILVIGVSFFLVYKKKIIKIAFKNGANKSK